MDQITIQGHTFNVPDRFAEGHVLTSNEASALNQTFHENLRNNFAKVVKDTKGEAETLADDVLLDLQSKLDAYAETYAFGVRAAGAPRAPSDPIGKEAFSVAREAVKAKLREKGINPNGIDSKQLGELVSQALEKYKERFTQIAVQRIADREALASDILSFDVGDAAPTAEATSEPKAKKAKKAA